MASDFIVPSEFHFVAQDTTIESCLQLMKEKSLSYLLVKDGRGKLRGIFTLKDVMNFDFLKIDKYIMQPVKKVMSHPVKTLPVHKLYKAAETMVRSNIRHLPITTGQKGRKNKVIGVVDMESMLKSSVIHAGDSHKTLNISVYSARSALRRLIQNSFKNDKLIRIDHLRKSGERDNERIESLVAKTDVLIFDLGGSEEFDMVYKLAQKVIDLEKRMVIIIARDVFLTNKERKSLETLGKTEPILLIEKPFEGHEFLLNAKTQIV